MEKTILVKMFLIVGIGAMIGWITNYLAIKMLFRPYKEINILGLKIQGLLPKRKHEIGKSLAEIIQKEIISLKDIVGSMDMDKLEIKISETLDEILDDKLESEIVKNFPMLQMFLSAKMLNKIRQIIKDSVLENKEKIMEMFNNYLEENIDFEKIIIERVDNFSFEKLEEVTYTFAKKEFKHIELIGGVLGGIIGIIQFGIGLII